MTDKIEIKLPYMKLRDILKDDTFCFPDIRDEWQKARVNYLTRILDNSPC